MAGTYNPKINQLCTPQSQSVTPRRLHSNYHLKAYQGIQIEGELQYTEGSKTNSTERQPSEETSLHYILGKEWKSATFDHAETHFPFCYRAYPSLIFH